MPSLTDTAGHIPRPLITKSLDTGGKSRWSVFRCEADVN